jgi:hypothetical protein
MFHGYDIPASGEASVNFDRADGASKPCPLAIMNGSLDFCNATESVAAGLAGAAPRNSRIMSVPILMVDRKRLFPQKKITLPAQRTAI